MRIPENMNVAPCRNFLLLKALTLSLSLTLACAARADGPPWSYSGAAGPAQWGSEDPAYAACGSGKLQSPIDIRNAEREELPALEFAYHPVPLVVTDTGHTMQVNVPAGSGGITVGQDHYELVQFHFHRPSEERIRGKRYALVAHLVHRNAAGKLAVVAVLFRAGQENALLKQVFENFPASGTKDKAVPGVTLDLTQLLPAMQGYYTFEGSLTMPPCSEGVRWFVLKRPMQAGTGQIARFAARYADDARPTQPRNGRKIAQTQN